MSDSSVYPDAVGDRPGVKKFGVGRKIKSPDKKKKSQGGELEPTQPGVEPRPAGAASGPKPSSAVASTTQGQSPTQRWTSRQQGSVFQQKPAALQGRQVEYYVDRSQSRGTSNAASRVGAGASRTPVNSGPKPLAIGGGRYANYQRSLNAYSQWRQGS